MIDSKAWLSGQRAGSCRLSTVLLTELPLCSCYHYLLAYCESDRGQKRQLDKVTQTIRPPHKFKHRLQLQCTLYTAHHMVSFFSTYSLRQLAQCFNKNLYMPWLLRGPGQPGGKASACLGFPQTFIILAAFKLLSPGSDRISQVPAFGL